MERLSAAIGGYLAGHLGLDDDRREVLDYGALVLIQNGLSLLAVVVLAVLAGLVPEVLVTVGVAALVRHYSGGIHLRTPVGCVVAGAAVFLLLGAAAGLLPQPPPAAALGVALGGLALLWRYAPVAAENRPLGPAHKAHLRRGSLRLGTALVGVLTAGAWLNSWWTTPALVGFMWQGLTLTPAGHALADWFDRFFDLQRGR